jgi:hypothetical protein
MSFEVGATVKTKGDSPEYGVVTQVDGQNITYRTAWRQTKTATAGDLEAATGMSAYFAKEGPDIMELLSNITAFAVVNKVAGGKGWMNAENVRFAVEDGLYEFLGKGYLKPYVDSVITIAPLTGDDMSSLVSQQDFMDGVNKGISITVLDTVYKLMTRKKLGAGIMWYFLKSAGSISAANIVQRYFEPKGANYSPQ